MIEGVDSSDNVSGSDKAVSEENSKGSFTGLGWHRENVWVTQCGSLWNEVVGLKGLSQFCSNVGVEPNESDGIFGVPCWEMF